MGDYDYIYGRCLHAVENIDQITNLIDPYIVAHDPKEKKKKEEKCEYS